MPKSETRRQELEKYISLHVLFFSWRAGSNAGVEHDTEKDVVPATLACSADDDVRVFEANTIRWYVVIHGMVMPAESGLGCCPTREAVEFRVDVDLFHLTQGSLELGRVDARESAVVVLVSTPYVLLRDGRWWQVNRELLVLDVLLDSLRDIEGRRLPLWEHNDLAHRDVERIIDKLSQICCARLPNSC